MQNIVVIFTKYYYKILINTLYVYSSLFLKIIAIFVG